MTTNDMHQQSPWRSGEARLTRRGALSRAALGAGALAAAAALPGGLATPALAATARAHSAKKAIAIGGKDFTEDQLVAHMYTLLLQQAGIPTSEHFGLATPALHNALLHGDIALYPEYTGTGLVDVLHMKAANDPIVYFDDVAAQYERRFHLTWLHPAPMNDTQGLATTKEIAQKYHIATISDMVRQASKLRFIANSEFLGRADGLPGLKKVYGNFSFKSTTVVASAGSVRYTALMHGQGDVVVAFTTDGLIAGDHLVLLKDDKNYAPPDNVAPVMRDDALTTYPQIRTILNALAPAITTSIITALNYQVDGQHQDIDTVAKSFLRKNKLLR